LALKRPFQKLFGLPLIRFLRNGAYRADIQLAPNPFPNGAPSILLRKSPVVV